MMLGLLGMLMVAAVGMSAMTGTTSETDEVDSNLPETETETGQQITLNAIETLSGTEGNDTITIETEAHPDHEYTDYRGDGIIQFVTYDDVAVAEIDAGSGDDTIVIDSGHAVIRTGAGADTVDAQNMSQGVVYAGDGDIVYGSDVGQVGVAVTGAGAYLAGTGGGIGVSIGDGGTLTGAEGRDFLFSENGSATLIGGDEDDFIDANATSNEYDGSTNLNRGSGDTSVDIVDAGDGDDIVEDVSNGDRVTLGEGSDTVTAWYDRSSTLEPVVFTDFDPTEDRIRLSVLGFAVGTTGDDTADFDLTGRFDILEGDGDSHLFVDDELVAVFENTTGLTAISDAFIDNDRGYFEQRLLLGRT